VRAGGTLLAPRARRAIAARRAPMDSGGTYVAAIVVVTLVLLLAYL
jgi:hypothetical protein